jgi:hypothetical protein
MKTHTARKSEQSRRVRLICSSAAGGLASASPSCTDPTSAGETTFDWFHRSSTQMQQNRTVLQDGWAGNQIPWHPAGCMRRDHENHGRRT